MPEEAMMVDVAGEERDAPPAEEVPAFPVRPARLIEVRLQESLIGGDIGPVVGLAEEAEEICVTRKMARSRKLQPGQCHVSAVEVDRHHFAGACRQIGKHVAAAGGDRHHPATRGQREGRHVNVGVFPDLRIDEVTEGEREDPLKRALPRRRFGAMNGLLESVGRSICQG